jgi:hypothetical protein
MQLGMGACTNVQNSVGTDSVTGEACVVTGVGTQVNVPMTGGATYVDASGNVIPAVNLPATTWIPGMSNSLVVAAGVVVVLALLRNR